MYTCRECEHEINQATEVCPYCGTDLTVVPGAEEQPKKKPSLAKALVLWGLAIAFLWLMVWVALPLRMLNPALQAESRALEAMSAVGADRWLPIAIRPRTGGPGQPDPQLLAHRASRQLRLPEFL